MKRETEEKENENEKMIKNLEAKVQELFDEVRNKPSWWPFK